MEFTAGKATGFGIALLMSAHAFALGLGEAAGIATLGQPLRLEIPLLGSQGGAPAASCFRLRAPTGEIGNDFVVRNGRIDVVAGGRPKLVVTTAAVVREPVIGFAVAAGCEYGVAKDYVLLVGLPGAAPAPVSAPETTRAETPAPAPVGEKPAARSGEGMHVDSTLTLEALARQKYPLQPKAREKFARMMLQANPSLPGIDAPIAAGTELRFPPGLPQRRTGPYLGEAKAAGQPAAATPPAAEAKPQTGKTKAGKDRLTVGQAPEPSESKLLAEAERLTGLMVEQNKTQEAMTENLAKLEADYAALHKQFVDMQARLARIEAERLAEKQAAKSSILSGEIVELLIAVLAGGALGGMVLHFVQRAQRKPDAGDMADVTGALDSLGPKPALRLPWAKKENPPASPAPKPVVVVRPATPAKTASEPEAVPSLVPADIAAAIAAAAAENAARRAPPAPMPEPEQPAVESKAALAAAAPAPEAVSEPEPEPPVVLEPLDFSPVAIPAAEPAAAPVAEPPAQETLTLDFPEIAIPGTEAAAGDAGNVLDFRKS